MTPISYLCSLKKKLIPIHYSVVYQIYQSFSDAACPSSTLLRNPSITKPQHNILFPWRHSSQPPIRLSKNYQGGKIGPNIPTFSPLIRNWMYLNAIGFMGLPLWEILLGRQWKHELCEGFCAAYERGLSTLLSEVYNVPIEMVINVDDENTENDQNSFKSREFSVNFQTEMSSQNPESARNKVKDNIYTQPKLDEMIDVKLHQLYQYSRESKNLSIQLYSKPIYSEIVSAFLVPFLTRQEVENYPELQKSFKNILKHVNNVKDKKGRSLSFWETTRLVMKDISTMGKNQIIRKKNIVQCTVIVQAMIHCQEIFHVKDKESGLVIQGKDDGLVKEVCHLVRFERVGSLFVGNKNERENRGDEWKKNEFQLENWKITDLDDIMDGNVFFM